jgi:uncharacterized protein YoxC
MAVGDSLLFTLRNKFGISDVNIELLEPRQTPDEVRLRTDVEITSTSSVSPTVTLRYTKQQADGRFTEVFTVSGVPNDRFTPDVVFTDNLDRGEFTIGIQTVQVDELTSVTPPPSQTLTAEVDFTAEEPDPIPPAEGPGQFNIVLPRLPLIQNDPRILASLTIPQIGSIKEGVAEAVPSISQIRTEVDLALNQPLADLERRVKREIRTEVDTITIPEAPDVPSANDIVTDVETTVVQPLDTAISQVSQDLTTKINDIVGDVDSALDDTFDNLAQGVQGAVDEIESVADDVGNVSNDIGSLNDIAVGEVESAVETAIENIEPKFNDSGLFSDPVGFAVGFVQEASDVIVDPEVSEDLQDRLEDR